MNRAQKNTILLSAGGTGGHVFPAVALAQALKKRGYDTAIVTDQRGERYLPSCSEDARVDWMYPRSQGAHRFLQLLSLLWVTLKMCVYMYRVRPAAVVGFGGYTSAPAVLAAKLLRVPTVLHEQNAVLGRVNRWLGRFVQRIALGFPETHYANFPHQVVVGNPIRQELWIAAQEAAELQEEPRNAVQPSDNALHVLVLGGSQGARVFADVMFRVCQLLSPEQRQQLRLKHQVRREQQDDVQASYKKFNIVAETAPFFSDIGKAYQWADVVICRSGASTVSEITLFQKRAIFIPLPSAADDHQTANAQTLVSRGRAWCIPETSETAAEIAQILIQLLHTRKVILPSSAGDVGRKIISEPAASKLAQVVEDLLAIK